MIQSLLTVLNILQMIKLYYGGKINILKQPEFQDLKKLRILLKLLKKKTIFIICYERHRLVSHVKIGTENKVPEMED